MKTGNATTEINKKNDGMVFICIFIKFSLGKHCVEFKLFGMCILN